MYSAEHNQYCNVETENIKTNLNTFCPNNSQFLNELTLNNNQSFNTFMQANSVLIFPDSSSLQIDRSKSLKIFHQNVQHLSSRLNLLKINLDEIQPDIVALSEHKMTEAEIMYLNVEDYTMCSFYTRNLSVGGGVLILVKNSIKNKSIKFPAVQALLMEKEFECCISEITVNKFSFACVCIYRSPQQALVESFFDKFDTLCSILCNKFQNVIITGDFNINVLKKNKTYRTFVNILKSYNLEYKVNFPTRVTSESETAIDNFVTNISSKKLYIYGIITHIADHDGQLFEIFDVKEIQNCVDKRLCRKFTKTNIDLFLRLLSRENWAEVYLAPVETKYDTFYSIFAYAFEVSFPKLLTVDKRNKPNQWISENVKMKKEEIVQVEKEYRVGKTEILKQEIKKLKCQVKDLIRSDKVQYFNSKIMKSTNKSKSTWNIIKSEVNNGSKTKENINISVDGKPLSDPIIVANVFNDFFINAVDNSVLPNLLPNAENKLPTEQCKLKTRGFNFKTVDEIMLKKVVMDFENKYSTGIDDIPITIVKQSFPFICKPLTHIFNSSLISGYFPCKLKTAKVIPLYKKGNASDLTSYRPISLLPIFSKILERLVYNQFLDYLERNHLLDDEQHGFRPGKSTITAGVHFIEKIIDSVDRNEKVIGIFLDLTKAFDSVSHDKLLNVLIDLNINGKEYKWFSSYLRNRQQCVQVQHTLRNTNGKYRYTQNFFSKIQTVKYGVPQGSILGPLLFLCYMKGFPKSVPRESTVCLYADDTNITISGKNQEDIELMSFVSLLTANEFLNSKNLLLNSNKSNFISFSTKQTRSKLEPNLFINNQKLNQVENNKFLGLIVDQNLSWDKHVDHVVNKMASGLYALRQMANFCTTETLKTIYFALINPHLSYGICIYGATTKRNLDRILLQQKKALRIIFNINKRETVKPYFSQLGILTVYDLYILETVSHVKKLNHYPTSNSNLHSYNTRNSRYIEQHNLKFFEKKTNFMGTKFLSKLPSNIRNENNFEKLKKLLKNYLLTLTLYSLDEFLQVT